MMITSQMGEDNLPILDQFPTNINLTLNDLSQLAATAFKDLYTCL